METAKKTNLLQLSSQFMAESQMKNVHGGAEDVYGEGVACGPSNCNGDVHTSVNNALANMRTNNPPI